MTKLRAPAKAPPTRRSPRPRPDDRRRTGERRKVIPATSEAEATRDAPLRNGVLVGVGGIHGNVIRFQPPLIITRQQIDQAIDAFVAAL